MSHLPNCADPDMPFCIRIRPATTADAPQALALFAQHLQNLRVKPDPALDSDMEDFPRAYERRGSFFCVVEDVTGRLLGMGGVMDRTVRRLHVSGPTRGHGLGRRILEHLCREHALRQGGPLRAVVASTNEAARRTFARCGFVPAPPGHTASAPAHCEIWEHPVPGTGRLHEP
jgi:GNAT superfamily N-acetyltransferase